MLHRLLYFLPGLASFLFSFFPFLNLNVYDERILSDGTVSGNLTAA